MNLELKHLASYLEHGLKVKNHVNNITELTVGNLGHYLELQVKPILRPLSDLTKGIEHNGEKFVPLISIVEEIKLK